MNYPTMFRVLASVLISTSLWSTHAFANGTVAVDLNAARPIVSSQARGNEVNLMGGEFRPVVSNGGFGPYVNSYQLILRFAYRQRGNSVVRLRNLNTNAANILRVTESSPSQYLKIIGTDESGVTTYESMIEGGNVSPSSLYSLEIISPVKYNTAPDLNNPTPGISGPVFGVTNIHGINN